MIGIQVFNILPTHSNDESIWTVADFSKVTESNYILVTSYTLTETLPLDSKTECRRGFIVGMPDDLTLTCRLLLLFGDKKNIKETCQ